MASSVVTQMAMCVALARELLGKDCKKIHEIALTYLKQAFIAKICDNCDNHYGKTCNV